MSGTDGLPTVEVSFNILAPEGGFQRSIRTLENGGRKFLDLKIQNLEGIAHWIRIQPDSTESVVDDKQRPGVYLITSALGYFITENGGEEAPGSPAIQVYAEINTEVRVPELPVGTLRMRHQRSGIQQIGA